MARGLLLLDMFKARPFIFPSDLLLPTIPILVFSPQHLLTQIRNEDISDAALSPSPPPSSPDSCNFFRPLESPSPASSTRPSSGPGHLWPRMRHVFLPWSLSFTGASLIHTHGNPGT